MAATTAYSPAWPPHQHGHEYQVLHGGSHGWSYLENNLPSNPPAYLEQHPTYSYHYPGQWQHQTSSYYVPPPPPSAPPPPPSASQPPFASPMSAAQTTYQPDQSTLSNIYSNQQPQQSQQPTQSQQRAPSQPPTQYPHIERNEQIAYPGLPHTSPATTSTSLSSTQSGWPAVAPPDLRRDLPNICQVRGCRRAYKRKAELDRHMSEKHGPSSGRLLCPVKMCPRGIPGEGFDRMSHLTQHLRSGKHKLSTEEASLLAREHNPRKAGRR